MNNVVAQHRRIIMCLWAAAIVVGAALAAGTMPSAAAEDCPDIDVTFARGLGDPPGPGPVGQAFTDSLRSQVGGRSMTVYGVDYPASVNVLTVGPGVTDATNHVNYMVANCPATRLVLGGFSEGAAVMDILTTGAIPAIPALSLGEALPPEAADHVAAVAVFGNPLGGQIGLLNSMNGVYSGRTIDLCAPGDPVCGGGTDLNAHHHYAPTFTDQAASFVAGLV